LSWAPASVEGFRSDCQRFQAGGGGEQTRSEYQQAHGCHTDIAISGAVPAGSSMIEVTAHRPSGGTRWTQLASDGCMPDGLMGPAGAAAKVRYRMVRIGCSPSTPKAWVRQIDVCTNRAATSTARVSTLASPSRRMSMVVRQTLHLPDPSGWAPQHVHFSDQKAFDHACESVTGPTAAVAASGELCVASSTATCVRSPLVRKVE